MEETLKKRKGLALLAVIIGLLALCVVFFISMTTFWSIPSPDKQYEVFGWTTDKGGWGYTGKIYFKESGLFYSWQDTKITPPAIVEWQTDNTFVIKTPGASVEFIIDSIK